MFTLENADYNRKKRRDKPREKSKKFNLHKKKLKKPKKCGSRLKKNSWTSKLENRKKMKKSKLEVLCVI
jgi:hypothetical protein